MAIFQTGVVHGVRISTKELTTGAVINEALNIFCLNYIFWGTYFIVL